MRFLVVRRGATALNWQPGSIEIPLERDVATSVNIGDYVTGEQSIALLSGSIPGMTYTPATGILAGTPTTDGTYDLSFRADDGMNPAAADWAARIADAGVVWYHNFDTQSELDQFRWMNGYGGGNDPLAADTNSPQATWVPAGGADGGGYVQFMRPQVLVAGGGSVPQDNLHWWRPFNPLTGASNGRGVDDPGANGTIPLSTFTPTDQGSQTARWSSTDNPRGGWYGHPDDQNSFYQGREFYLQIRVMADPRRSTPGNIDIGKFTNITTTNAAHSNQQLVTYAGYWSGAASVGMPNIHNVYDGYGSTTPLADLGSGPIENPTNPQWSYSFGWDTLLYHVVPGHSGVSDTLFEVWAAREGETTYTKIWQTTYMARYSSGTEDYKVHRPGWNAFMLWIFHNGAAMSEFWQRYDQIIFSHGFIPCPQV